MQYILIIFWSYFKSGRKYCFNSFTYIFKYTGVQPILAKDHFSPVHCYIIFLNNAKMVLGENWSYSSTCIRIKMILIRNYYFSFKLNYSNIKLQITFHFLKNEKNMQAYNSSIIQQMHKYIPKKKNNKKNMQLAVYIYSQTYIYDCLMWREFLPLWWFFQWQT